MRRLRSECSASLNSQNVLPWRSKPGRGRQCGWGESEGEDAPTSHFFRQGKRSIFHSYQAFLMGPGGLAMVCWAVVVGTYR